MNRRHPVIQSIVVLLFALLVGACKDVGPPRVATAPLTRDSAGIEIIEYPAEAWDTNAVWRLDQNPILTIGVIEGPPEYELANVTGAIRLDDGTIVVINASSGELRFYDSSGVYMRSVGRRGDGPGEYQFASAVGRYGIDSLVVWDAGLSRGSVLARDGTFAHNFSVPASLGDISVLGAFGDGGLLGSLSRAFRPNELASGMIRHTAIYIRLFPSGQADTIASLFSNEGFNTRGAYYLTPFSRRAVAAATGEYVHYGSSDNYEIRTYRIPSKLIRIIRSARTTPLSQGEVDRVIAGVGSARARDALSMISYPHTKPAYSQFRTDTDGNLWVEDYVEPGKEKEAQSWTIFGPAGELRGRVMTPARFTVLDIGSDYLLGDARGEMDTEQILIYRLIKPESATAEPTS